MKQGLKIVFEDDWLIVVEKPSGLLTMATDKGREVTAYSMLFDYVCECAQQGGRGRGAQCRCQQEQPRIFIVHRLDRDTSGLLVFAKDEETKRALMDNWEDAVQERRYIAILEGQIDSEEGYIETWMYENQKSLMVHCYDMRPGDTPEKPPRKDWKYASSHCRKTRELTIDGKPYTEVEFNLETGRRNQIRVHSQYIGHPIAGDRKYGAQTNPFGRLALHAQGLAFIHPWTGKTLKFTAPLPRNLRQNNR
jgi:23S rRNA pseudouridine1911/1915/1917 synthase